MVDLSKDSWMVTVLAAAGGAVAIIGMFLSFTQFMGDLAVLICIPAAILTGIAMYMLSRLKMKSSLVNFALVIALLCTAIAGYQHLTDASGRNKAKKELAMKYEESEKQDNTLSKPVKDPEAAASAETAKIDIAPKMEDLDQMKQTAEAGGADAQTNVDNTKLELVTLNEQLKTMTMELEAEKKVIDDIQAAGITEQNYEDLKSKIIAYNTKLNTYAEIVDKRDKLQQGIKKPSPPEVSGSKKTPPSPNDPVKKIDPLGQYLSSQSGTNQDQK